MRSCWLSPIESSSLPFNALYMSSRGGWLIMSSRCVAVPWASAEMAYYYLVSSPVIFLMLN